MENCKWNSGISAESVANKLQMAVNVMECTPADLQDIRCALLHFEVQRVCIQMVVLWTLIIMESGGGGVDAPPAQDAVVKGMNVTTHGNLTCCKAIIMYECPDW